MRWQSPFHGRWRRARPVGLAALACLTLVACTAGPDFVRPDPPVSDAYHPGSLVVETARTDILHGHSQRLQP